MLSEEELMGQIKSATQAASNFKIDETEVLFETRKEFTIKGEKISVRPFSFGELPIVLKLLKNVGSYFAVHQKNGTLKSIDGMMEIMAVGGENLMQALALNIGKPREWLNDISPEDGVQMTEEFLFMNLNFFTKRVLPAIKALQKE